MQEKEQRWASRVGGSALRKAVGGPGGIQGRWVDKVWILETSRQLRCESYSSPCWSDGPAWEAPHPTASVPHL